MNRNNILKMVVILASIVVIAGSLSRLLRRDSMTLTEYAKLNSSQETGSTDTSPSSESDDTHSSESSGANESQSLQGTGSEASGNDETPSSDAPGNSESQPIGSSSGSESQPTGSSGSSESNSDGNSDGSESQPTENSGSQTDGNLPQTSALTGAVLNGTSMLEDRVSLTDDFYYEPVSDKLQRYMTGITYPEEDTSEDAAPPAVTFDELRYVHILHYDFEGNSTEGELICNEYIAQDVTEIFLELYRNEYRLERVLLMDEYDGDDNLSMEDNNTSCFNYRVITNSSSLSMHAYGLAVDINPLYNPYISYSNDGTQEVLPASAQPYADRNVNFPYKIDENDLCYKLFYQHGFTWGGNWNNLKDYQHFQKAKP